MKTTVVCGLLGAGKTTFIKNRLQGGSGKTVVLVNDFGAAGIDGEIFAAAGIASLELPSGCVCCTLKPDLIAAISTAIRDFSPEHLLIEPSGVASPSAVLDALAMAGIDAAVVVGIVDSTEFGALYESGIYGSFFEDQIVRSDIVLVNKADLAGEIQIQEALRIIEQANPHALAIRTVNCVLSADVLLEQRKGGGITRGKQPHLHFESLSFRVGRGASLVYAATFFHELAKGRFGSVARAKALLETDAGAHRFDLVFGKAGATRFEKEIAEGRIVIIGTGLDRQAMLEAIRGMGG